MKQKHGSMAGGLFVLLALVVMLAAPLAVAHLTMPSAATVVAQADTATAQ